MDGLLARRPALARGRRPVALVAKEPLRLIDVRADIIWKVGTFDLDLKRLFHCKSRTGVRRPLIRLTGDPKRSTAAIRPSKASFLCAEFVRKQWRSRVRQELRQY